MHIQIFTSAHSKKANTKRCFQLCRYLSEWGGRSPQTQRQTRQGEWETGETADISLSPSPAWTAGCDWGRTRDSGSCGRQVAPLSVSPSPTRPAPLETTQTSHLHILQWQSYQHCPCPSLVSCRHQVTAVNIKQVTMSTHSYYTSYITSPSTCSYKLHNITKTMFIQITLHHQAHVHTIQFTLSTCSHTAIYT